MIKLIIYLVIALLVLSFFGISLQHVVQSPATQANFNFFWELVQQGWHYALSWLTATAQSFGGAK